MPGGEGGPRTRGTDMDGCGPEPRYGWDGEDLFLVNSLLSPFYVPVQLASPLQGLARSAY